MHTRPLGPDAGLYPVGSQVQLISQSAAPTVISPGPVCLELERNGKNMMPPRLRPPPPMRALLPRSHMWSDRATALQHIKAHIMTIRERWDGCMRHYCSTETSLFPSHSTENIRIFIWMQPTWEINDGLQINHVSWVEAQMQINKTWSFSKSAPHSGVEHISWTLALPFHWVKHWHEHLKH